MPHSPPFQSAFKEASFDSLMDFRSVEPRFRKYAFVVQAGMIGLLVAFVSYNVVEIVRHQDSPPVETSMESWVGAGKWAICAHSLSTAGMAMEARAITKYHRPTSETSKGWDLARTVEVYATTHINCSIVDLMQHKLTTFPTSISLCGKVSTGESSWLLFWSGGQWHYAGQIPFHSQASFLATKRRHGWNFGYQQEMEDYFHVTLQYTQNYSPNENWRPSDYCTHWTPFGGSAVGGTNAAFLTFEDPLVLVTVHQGVFVRLFALLSNIGGYVTMLTLAFGAIFVKRNPHGEVARAYDSRTLVGHQQREGEGELVSAGARSAGTIGLTQIARLRDAE